MANLVTKPQVEFMDAVKLAFKKSFTFTGRIRRSEYWWGVLAIWIINILLFWIPVVGQLVSLYLGIVSLAMAFRRLHDTNHSGWWIGGPALGMVAALLVILCAGGAAALTGDINAIAGASIGAVAIAGILYLVSGIMSIVVLVFCCMDSEQTANKFGESPKYVVENETTAAPLNVSIEG